METGKILKVESEVGKVREGGGVVRGWGGGGQEEERSKTVNCMGAVVGVPYENVSEIYVFPHLFPDWTLYGDQCYRLYTKLLSWQAALDVCRM